MEKPPLGLTVRCELVDVLDGRTVRVRALLGPGEELDVQILGLSVPECRGDEMALGLASAQALQSLIGKSDCLTVHLPHDQIDATEEPIDGNLFVGEKDVAQELSSLGYGTLVARTARELGLEA